MAPSANGMNNQMRSPEATAREMGRGRSSKLSTRSNHARTALLCAEQRRVEQHSERTERLPAPLGSEAKKHDMACIELNVECRGLPEQMLLADQVTGQQRRSPFPIPRQHRPLEPVLRLEDWTAVDKHRR